MTTETIVKPTLNQQLYGVREFLASVAPAEGLQIIEDDIQRLEKEGYAEHALKAGATAPDFTLPGVNGEAISLADLLATGPVVLVFYRGAWCPYCNTTLKAYQAVLPQIQELSATLVAISAQTPDNSLAVAEKNELTFPVLTDRYNQVARQYGLVFQVGEAVRPVLTSLGADVAAHNGEDSWELPVPGIFVIGTDGIIKLASVDPDFRNRLEPSDLIAALQEL